MKTKKLMKSSVLKLCPFVSTWYVSFLPLASRAKCDDKPEDRKIDRRL
jgi:hypothetical protein